MKILKVELQNINSLKSDSPIVIDFENEKFTDVGLYAITGSTGAGKTTILDAITIALYHSVPRFNGSKGTLVDVVSHGAHNAFTRITFENDSIIYEVYWGIRIADKTGKKYKNPKEEVRLKNLTSETILATQKRLLLLEITRVTQLDYNQFLRSVMLAQGEFASFLTAKGPEKGKLLEQITGEQIYKKIGQSILERKSAEENKLKDLEAKINADDLLTDELRIALKQKDQVLDTEIAKIEKDLKVHTAIADWHTNFKKNQEASEVLEKAAKQIDNFIENHKAELDLLTLNEKAEPFKELIQNINRTKKEREGKETQLNEINTALEQLKPKIASAEKSSTTESEAQKTAEKALTDWLPKFDTITKLDGQLKNISESKTKTTQQLTAINTDIKATEVEHKDLVNALIKANDKLKIDEAFVSENEFLKEVATEIATWSSKLSTLKASKDTIQQDLDFITKKETAVKKTVDDLKVNATLLDKKIVAIENNEKKLATISAQLSKNNSTNLSAEHAKQTALESNWKQFKALAEQTIKAEKQRGTLIAEEKTKSTELTTTNTTIETLKEKIELQEKLVLKAEQVLDLEKRISKYEDDRQYLKEGEPCGLCGSKEHPYVDASISYNISETELALKKAKADLKISIDSKNEHDKIAVQLHTTIATIKQQLKTTTEDIAAFKLSANTLNIECELTAISKINAEINKTTVQITALNTQLADAQKLQTDKDKLAAHTKEQNEAITDLKTKVATLKESIKNGTEEIDAKRKSIDKLNKVYADLEETLKTSLSKYNYELPTITQTDSFIKTLETSIVDFNKKQKEVAELKARITLINNNLSNTKKQLKTHTNTKNEFTKAIGGYETESANLANLRNAILPLAISVEHKRNSLVLLKNKCTEKAELSKNKLQLLLDSKNKNETLKVKTTKEKDDLIKLLELLKTTLASELKGTTFQSKEAVENALLAPEKKLEYTKNKDRIKEQLLELKTRKSENSKTKEALIVSKKSEISEADNKIALENLNTKNKDALSKKGELVEAFRKDQEIRNRNKEIYSKIETQANICTVWKELFRIIGNSKDAFNVYVQRLTLKHLLDLANVHLYKLNKRYSLKMEDTYKPKEELNFNLIDHYQTDQSRLVDTSSGGEKFIISLALALGLSDLASKNVKIDSLFIDEGFGTLDSNTLETVISTLETLQSQGKMIGIISHVENLKERIPTQIQIAKKSNGVSVVEII